MNLLYEQIFVYEMWYLQVAHAACGGVLISSDIESGSWRLSYISRFPNATRVHINKNIFVYIYLKCQYASLSPLVFCACVHGTRSYHAWLHDMTIEWLHIACKGLHTISPARYSLLICLNQIKTNLSSAINKRKVWILLLFVKERWKPGHSDHDSSKWGGYSTK